MAADHALLNIDVDVHGFAAILDLNATQSATPDAINLSWTEPSFNGITDPRSYDIRVSTIGQISSDADFSVAKPLSAFSPSAIPAPGLGGGTAAMSVANLLPGPVYYFAIRERDSTAPTPLTGLWVRDDVLYNVNNSTTAIFGTVPAAVVDLAAAPGPVEGDILLTWTAPVSPTQSALGSYDIRYATFSVASWGAGADAWFAAATYRVAIPTTTAAGDAQSIVFPGLAPGTTFYFAIKSADLLGDVSPIDLHAGAAQAQSMPRNFPPAVPHGLATAAGINRAVLTWAPLTPAEKGLEFAFYRVQRSTYPDHDFVDVATTTAVSLTDKFLTPFTSYYYRLSARDLHDLESVFTSTVSVLPFNLPPEEPQAIRSVLSADGSSTTFSWAPAKTFDDGSPFESTGTPTADELQGYRILRSTSFFSPDFTYLSSAPLNASTYTASTGGSFYYYRIQSYNTAGASTETLVVSSLGEQSFCLAGSATRLTITDAMASALSPDTNGLGVPVHIKRRFRPEDVGGDIFQSVEFRAMRDGWDEIKAFHFDQPAWVILHYSTGAGGSPVAAMSAASVQPAALSASNLGVYWFNGAEFKKLYGKVDQVSQTVAVQTPNVGLFQIRALLRSNGAVFDLSNLSGRVITPNGDGKNDALMFGYDPGPNNVLPTGRIYDVKGMFVAAMTLGLVPNTLVWDGRMNGRYVTGGVYVYEIKGDGKTFSGTIVVAR